MARTRIWGFLAVVGNCGFLGVKDLIVGGDLNLTISAREVWGIMQDWILSVFISLSCSLK